jgi:hypothetical protein
VTDKKGLQKAPAAKAGTPARGVDAQSGTDDGNPGTLVGIETRDGVRYARYRATQGTWVSSSLKQMGYDKTYGKDTAYGAYSGVARGVDGSQLSNPDKIKPGQEYLIPVGTARNSAPPPPPSRDLPANGIPPNLQSGTFSARLLPKKSETPPEIVAADPRRAGVFASPDIPRWAREDAVGAANPEMGVWLYVTLRRIVGNFQINLKLPLNDPSVLKAAGMITPGQDPGTVRTNGSPQNAFRHAFGQALITRRYGRNAAEVVGSAHEDAPTIDTKLRDFSNRTTPPNALFEADTVADQLNNEIGRQIAERLGPKATNRDTALAVLRVFREDGLYVASFRGKGEVSISRQRISEDQFQLSKWWLKVLNEEGRVELKRP